MAQKAQKAQKTPPEEGDRAATSLVRFWAVCEANPMSKTRLIELLALTGGDGSLQFWRDCRK